MPKVLEFSFKNVCSYGNKLQVIPFGDTPQLMLIVGENGAGKTTIGNALEFSWYGRTRRRRIKELSNRLNGHLETYNKFLTDDGRVVEIARGIDPAHFDLIVDGEPDNKAGKTRIDEYIENELLGMPFEVCTNTMILSINDFKSFVKIKAEDKRKIVDRIFSMDILNKMNVLLKDDLRVAREDLAKVQAVINNQNTVLQQSEAQLAELKANLSTEAEKRKAELEGLIAALETDIRNTTAAAVKAEQEVSSLLSEMTKKLEDIQAEYIEIDNDAITRTSQAEAAFDQDVLRACTEIDAAQKLILDSYDAQYSETIGKLTREANEATTELKTALDAKLAAIETRYAAMEQSEAKKRDDALAAAEKKKEDDKAAAENEYKDRVKDISIEIEGINTEIQRLSDTIRDLRETRITAKLNSQAYEAKIALYEKNKCPECDGDLTTHEHANRKAEYQKLASDAEAEITRLDNEITESTKNFNAANAKLADVDKRSTANDNRYADMLQTIRDGFTEASEEINMAFGDAKYSMLQEKNIEISGANKEYSDAFAAVNAKLDQIKTFEHERDMKKEQAKSEHASKKAAERDRHAAVLGEKIKAISAAKDLALKKNAEKSASVNKEYGELVANKRQEAAVLRQKQQGYEAQRNLHAQDLADVQTKLADNASVKSLEQMVETARGQMISLLADEADANNRIKLCLATQELLLEDGIKKKFMGMVLPAMNATIKRIIDELQYKFGFHFDEDFNAVIEHMGHEVSPESLSTGEEKMIDLIVVLAVMELIKMKHPKVNVMFLDEVFASLDQSNIEKVIKILKDFMHKYGMTLFAISHTMMPKEHFDKVITVTNDGMFSDLAIS